ncbi:hypothetical protein KY363_02385 [Candidatus Woesearchaeota archaeon]|nr:hypothetical protein [Candidatus Woesearchaeota archaeon]
MTYALFTTVMEWLHVGFLIVASVLSMFLVRRFWRDKHKNQLMIAKRRVFTLLAPAIISMLAAFTAKYIYALPGCSGWMTAYDFFITISYLLFIAALGYFWYEVKKLHKLHIKEPIFMFGVICGIFLFNYYMYVIALLPATAGKTPVMEFLILLYPVMVSLMFILTLIIHPVLKAGIIRTPMWYISSAVFTYFIGFEMYYYHMYANPSVFLPPFYSAAFVISAFTLCIGLEAALKKYQGVRQA